jgi:hypothetical protein
MSYTRTITLTKTEKSPANAFDLFPTAETVATPEEIAEYESQYPRQRTVEMTENSMIITLVFPDSDIATRVITEPVPVQERLFLAKKVWIEENFIDEVVEAHETV